MNGESHLRTRDQKPFEELSQYEQLKRRGHLSRLDILRKLQNFLGGKHTKKISALIDAAAGIPVKKDSRIAVMYPKGTDKNLARQLVKEKYATQERFDMYFKEKEGVE